MKKQIFAKIIELEDKQVLIKQFFEHDKNGSYQVSLETLVDDIIYKYTFGFETEDDQNHLFDNITEAEIMTIIQDLDFS